ncbi:MAG: transposase, partial [Nitrosopumilaceae archaeon]|nr:transposase [Nitrosopumilaceae archaeon]
ILEELKRARFIQIDETPYRYRKRKGYVWVIRTDTVCMVLALSGRGNDDILPFVGDLLDKPVTVDGYSVYLLLFGTLQRCWAHILRDAEDVCISHPKIPHYRDLCRSLKMIFHRAKGVAACTAADGGAHVDTCRQFADEVRDL